MGGIPNFSRICPKILRGIVSKASDKDEAVDSPRSTAHVRCAALPVEKEAIICFDWCMRMVFMKAVPAEAKSVTPLLFPRKDLSSF